MNSRRRIVTEGQQSLTFSRRSFLLSAIQLGVGGVLAARMGWLSVAQNEKYALLSESNRINLTIVPPRRGWIVDRAGRPLALNRTTYRVDILPDRVSNKEKLLSDLRKLLPIEAIEFDRIREELDDARGFKPVVVAENLDWNQFAAVSVRAASLPGVAPSQSYARFYPEGAGVGHLLGYVGAATAEEYENQRDPLLVTPGFKVGKAGMEKALDGVMRGKAGGKRTEVTAAGKLVRDLATKPDDPGDTIKLTIDAGLQAYAARRLGNESGSIVVIDCQNGDILSMVSMPCFDPNSFSDGIGRLEWKMLQEDDHIPMLNKVLQGLYPPGSTAKPAHALALLHAGVDPEQTVFCSGGYRLGNRFIRCLGHHGTISMRDAIMKSCNTYFYAMAHKVGYDRIAPTARELGLGEKFDLPFPSQRYGTVPDSAWKQRKYKQKWSVADSLNATIGQGYLIVSPFQLAVMSARIASGKHLMPRIFAGKERPAPPLTLSPEHLAIVREGMDRVVNSAGTGARSRLTIPGVKMAGKTGTAQVRAIKGSSRGQSGVWKFRDHGLFVCYAPTENPRYAAAVVIDHGLGGARAAAPVAKDVLTYLFDPEQAMATLSRLESSWGGDIHTRMKRKRDVWMASHDPETAAAQKAAEEAANAANASDAPNTSNAVEDDAIDKEAAKIEQAKAKAEADRKAKDAAEAARNAANSARQGGAAPAPQSPPSAANAPPPDLASPTIPDLPDPLSIPGVRP
jgi:penicillin-binding protein 2